MYEESAITAIEQSNEIMDLSTDSIFEMARNAERTIEAINKIMQASLKITTEKDWVLIGGNPYLQETGATKVRALFGVSWKINSAPEIETHDDGHKTFTYRGTFTFKGSSIDAEGSRSSRDEFFTGKGGKKSSDEVDMRDVRMAAYTNCINNGMKRIIPGLRNIDVSALEGAGLKVASIRGYTFKQGSKGGIPNSSTDSGLVCADCNTGINQSVASFSEGKFGRILCMACQKKERGE